MEIQKVLVIMLAFIGTCSLGIKAKEYFHDDPATIHVMIDGIDHESRTWKDGNTAHTEIYLNGKLVEVDTRQYLNE